ncbi:hypothetical protein HK102_013351 [Quaeritorhiza haematococci]|nr:hypothetical protein HK102_013351 [Quaeritorhiza haematococci]
MSKTTSNSREHIPTDDDTDKDNQRVIYLADGDTMLSLDHDLVDEGHSGDGEDDDDDENLTIHSILDRRVKNNVAEYKVKWHNLPKPTWIPLAALTSFQNGESELDRYHNRRSQHHSRPSTDTTNDHESSKTLSFSNSASSPSASLPRLPNQSEAPAEGTSNKPRKRRLEEPSSGSSTSSYATAASSGVTAYPPPHKQPRLESPVDGEESDGVKRSTSARSSFAARRLRIQDSDEDEDEGAGKKEDLKPVRVVGKEILRGGRILYQLEPPSKLTNCVDLIEQYEHDGGNPHKTDKSMPKQHGKGQARLQKSTQNIGVEEAGSVEDMESENPSSPAQPTDHHSIEVIDVDALELSEIPRRSSYVESAKEDEEDEDDAVADILDLNLLLTSHTESSVDAMNQADELDSDEDAIQQTDDPFDDVIDDEEEDMEKDRGRPRRSLRKRTRAEHNEPPATSESPPPLAKKRRSSDAMDFTAAAMSPELEELQPNKHRRSLRSGRTIAPPSGKKKRSDDEDLWVESEDDQDTGQNDDELAKDDRRSKSGPSGRQLRQQVTKRVDGVSVGSSGSSSRSKQSGKKAAKKNRSSSKRKKRPTHWASCDKCAGGPQRTRRRGSDDDLEEDVGELHYCRTCSAAIHSLCDKPRKTLKNAATSSAASTSVSAGVGESQFQCTYCAQDSAICLLCKRPPTPSHLERIEDKQTGKPTSGAADMTEVVLLDDDISNHIDDGDKSGNIMFRCIRCGFVAHMSCIVEEFERNFPDEDEYEYGYLRGSPEWFATSWQCVDCTLWNSDVDAVLTYREVLEVDEDEQANGEGKTESGGEGTADNVGKSNFKSSTGTGDEGGKVVKEYLVKFQEFSHVHARWVPERWLKGLKRQVAKYRNFVKRVEDENRLALQQGVPAPWPKRKYEVIDREWMRVEKVLAVEWQDGIDFDVGEMVAERMRGRSTRAKAKGRGTGRTTRSGGDSTEVPPMGCAESVLVKWRGLSYEGSTWELMSEYEPYGEENDDDVDELVAEYEKSTERSKIQTGRTDGDDLLAEVDDDADDLVIDPLNILSNGEAEEIDSRLEERERKQIFNDIKAAWPAFVKRYHVSADYCHQRLNDNGGSSGRKKKRFQEVSKQPAYLQSGTLKDYQLEGVNWLLYNWTRGIGSILADDMGLGKTLQIVATTSIIHHEYGKGPFLIVCPTSTQGHWLNEFRKWSPDLVVVSYAGTKNAREIIRTNEIFGDTDTDGGGLIMKADVRCHVVVTNYENIVTEVQLFKKLRWEVLVCDEGHRLKNDMGKTFAALKHYVNADHRVLMTGTPLQNNMRELFNIMNFLDGDKFSDQKEWEQKYSNLSEDLVVQLHEELKPYFLRRTKRQVLKDLPPKAEVLVPVALTSLQKELYKAVLSKNLSLLKKLGVQTASDTGTSDAGANRVSTSLHSILTELRKICGHPYLFGVGPSMGRSFMGAGAQNSLYSHLIQPQNLSTEERHRALVEASGKLQLLRPMLVKLKQRGHRVLLFSQFKLVLDVLEEFLAGENLQYCRLDGDTPAATRQQMIDAYNSPNSDIFIFLLTTRTGGLGINLVTADTIIIYDDMLIIWTKFPPLSALPSFQNTSQQRKADWNPHQDLQAMARAHRIGQEKPVLVYKLFTRNCVEERIIEIGKRKLVLDHLIVEQMNAETVDKAELSSIIRFGAAALFASDMDKSNNNEGDKGETPEEDVLKYDEPAIDKLLDRDEILRSQHPPEVSEGGDAGLPNGGEGSKNAFSFARVWTLEKTNEESKDDENVADADSVMFDVGTGEMVGTGQDNRSEKPDEEMLDDGQFWDRLLKNNAASAVTDEVDDIDVVEDAGARNLRRRRNVINYNERTFLYPDKYDSDGTHKKSSKKRTNDDLSEFVPVDDDMDSDATMEEDSSERDDPLQILVERNAAATSGTGDLGSQSGLPPTFGSGRTYDFVHFDPSADGSSSTKKRPISHFTQFTRGTKTSSITQKSASSTFDRDTTIANARKSQKNPTSAQPTQGLPPNSQPSQKFTTSAQPTQGLRPNSQPSQQIEQQPTAPAPANSSGSGMRVDGKELRCWLCQRGAHKYHPIDQCYLTGDTGFLKMLILNMDRIRKERQAASNVDVSLDSQTFRVRYQIVRRMLELAEQQQQQQEGQQQRQEQGQQQALQEQQHPQPPPAQSESSRPPSDASKRNDDGVHKGKQVASQQDVLPMTQSEPPTSKNLSDQIRSAGASSTLTTTTDDSDDVQIISVKPAPVIMGTSTENSVGVSVSAATSAGVDTTTTTSVSAGTATATAASLSVSPNPIHNICYFCKQPYHPLINCPYLRTQPGLVLNEIRRMRKHDLVASETAQNLEEVVMRSQELRNVVRLGRSKYAASSWMGQMSASSSAQKPSFPADAENQGPIESILTPGARALAQQTSFQQFDSITLAPQVLDQFGANAQMFPPTVPLGQMFAPAGSVSGGSEVLPLQFANPTMNLQFGFYQVPAVPPTIINPQLATAIQGMNPYNAPIVGSTAYFPIPTVPSSVPTVMMRGTPVSPQNNNNANVLLSSASYVPPLPATTNTQLSRQQQLPFAFPNSTDNNANIIQPIFPNSHNPIQFTQEAAASQQSLALGGVRRTSNTDNMLHNTMLANLARMERSKAAMKSSVLNSNN